MDIKDIVSQYKNPDLCAKWDNNIPASELEYTGNLCLDSQVLTEVISSFPFLSFDDITGAIISLGDGDYGEVYVTESSRPYSLDAIYHPLDYYL